MNIQPRALKIGLIVLLLSLIALQVAGHYLWGWHINDCCMR
jgi:hypothetical protein